MIEYLTSHTVLSVFLCLGLGYILGKIRIRSFSLGATVGTLIVGLIMSQSGVFSISPDVKSIFFCMFIFTIGYDVGPAFFSSFRSSGVKIVLLSLFFTAAGFGVAVSAGKIFGIDAGTLTGIVAGALTQTSIIGAAELDEAMTANAASSYAITYLFGTLGVILFVKTIAPALLRVNLIDEVKKKVDRLGYRENNDTSESQLTVQTRAYIVEPESKYDGHTVEELENISNGKLEIISVFRAQKELPFVQSTQIFSGDVLLLTGRLVALEAFDNEGLTETSEPMYHKISQSNADIVLTKDLSADGKRILTENNILLKSASRNGKNLPDDSKLSFNKRNILSVVGPTKGIDKAAKLMGYIKDNSTAADMAFFALAITVGLLIGSLAVHIGGISITLGESGGALLSGLLCGWWYGRRPKHGYIPAPTRWFVKSIGLNLYIAALALQVGNGFLDALLKNGILILLIGITVTLLPHLLTMLFGKYVLRLDAVDILGGQCGCGTCTAALNALAEETNSSIFAVSYAPGYAVGNILLTVIGLLIPFILK